MHLLAGKGVLVRTTLAAWFLVIVCVSASAQSPTGSIGGIVFDPDAKIIAGAEIIIVNDLTRVQYETKTNNEGIYAVPNLPPGPYRVQVSKVGFKTLIKPDIILNVQDAITLNFTLPVGAESISVTVEGGSPVVNTTDAAVSTVVDRQFAENLPLNGRSFQSLIQLTPGVVVVPSQTEDGGQFSVNGQRAASNYWMIDGVSANIGTSAYFNTNNSTGGALGGFSIFGGTNSLVSVDALQEFRIQTSTYAPEFGRTPGGQISIVTRSGTDQFHGTVFNYFRNDALDANDWFTDSLGVRKPEERQNDFGGTFGGRILKDRTFFFFSYEGLRLRLPQVAQTTVPSLSARKDANTSVQPFLTAFPVPAVGAPDVGGASPFNASFSNRGSLDAYSLRVDDRLNSNVTIFGRYSYSPSELLSRGTVSSPLSDVSPGDITTQTATGALIWRISAAASNDFRLNYSRTLSTSSFRLDTFGGATPLASLPFPSGFDAGNGNFFFDIFSLANSNLFVGKNVRNLQRQINVVDGLSYQVGAHGLKFGVDFRRLTPQFGPRLYDQDVFFSDVPSAAMGTPAFSRINAYKEAELLLRNIGIYAQDTWKVLPRLTVTYGLRWDVDFSPASQNGPNLPAVMNYSSPANLALAPTGTNPFQTTWGNFAPRLGVAYKLAERQDRMTVLRGGFGVFYDLVTSEAGNLLASGYPFNASAFTFGGQFPLDATTSAPPPITPASLASGTLSAYNPHIELPYALEWNVALEQSLDTRNSLSVSYIGSVGRRLLQTEEIIGPNTNFGTVNLVGNTATSDYNALQIQYQRRLSAGLQALVSYTFAHSIDTASAGSVGNPSNAFAPSALANANRGDSDFDIRHAFTAGVTYQIPTPRIIQPFRSVLGNWSLQNVVQVRSAPPVDLYDSAFNELANSYYANIRPDIIAGVPLVLTGFQYPGGKAFNPAAFVIPPLDSVTGLPARQGDLGRNSLRGFGAKQWDMAVHRDFPIGERVRLQFRAELFNVLNHPNFGQPVGDLSNPHFGRSVQVLSASLAGGNLGSGGFYSLYQLGGPRSVQLALKLNF